MVELQKGTIELVPILITDTLSNLDDLTGSNPRFQYGLKDTDDLSTLTSALIDDDNKMLLHCLIDTTALDYGTYDLFVIFGIAPQYPRLKFKFSVN